MSRSFSSGEWQGSEGPLFTLGGLRVDLTLALIFLHTLAMAAAAILAASGREEWVNLVAFAAGDLKSGQIWTLVTYPFVHDIRMEGLWFGLEMLVFYWCGREVESVMGRRPYALLWVALSAVPALILAATGSFLGSRALAGSGCLTFAIFLAFCALHPDAQFFFVGLRARWVGWILLAIYTLADAATRDWPGLAQRWLCALIAVTWIRRGALDWPSLPPMANRKKAAKSKGGAKKTPSGPSPEKVDDILDKISREGIDSLTAAEKKQLEEARAKLLQKDRQKG